MMNPDEMKNIPPVGETSEEAEDRSVETESRSVEAESRSVESEDRSVQPPTDNADGELFQYETTEKQPHRTKKVRTGLLHKLMPMIVLLSALVVLTGVYFVLRKISPNTTSETGQVNTVKITDFTSTDVKSVYVINNQDEYKLYKKSGSVYKIEGKEDKESSSAYISTAIEKLSAVESVKKIEVQRAKLSEYGLEKPAGRAEIKTAKDSVTLYLGNQATDEDYYYMLLADDPNGTQDTAAVYLVEAETAELLSKTRLYYYDQDISGYDADNDNDKISPIIIGGTKGTAVSVRNEQESSSASEDGTTKVDLSFMMYQPISMPFSTTAMNSILSLLTTLNDCTAVSDDISAAMLEKTGLDHPDYTLHFGNNTMERTILFGKTDGDTIFCMRKDGGVIYTVAKSAVSCLSLSLADMCDVITYTRDVDTVRNIRLTGKQRSYDIKLVGTGDDRVVYVNNKQVDRSSFSEFYAGILGIEVQKEGTKPKGDPYVSIEMTLDDGSKETLNYYVLDERYCYYELNSTGMFCVSREAVDSLLTNAQKLYDNQEIVLAW